jgi:hypothetical protein
VGVRADNAFDEAGAGLSPWQVDQSVGMTAEMVERLYADKAMRRQTVNTPRRACLCHRSAQNGATGRERA